MQHRRSARLRDKRQWRAPLSRSAVGNELHGGNTPCAIVAIKVPASESITHGRSNCFIRIVCPPEYPEAISGPPGAPSAINARLYDRVDAVSTPGVSFGNTPALPCFP